ncbi:MAG TPA: FHA domain-containing protein [Fimbriimonadaceae bacterium]|nr:FHA domain-containing protein [Fimbriimonadaceae bacterium]
MTDPNRTQLGSPPLVDPNKTIMGSAPSLNATITIKPVQCPVCKTFNPAGVMFCVECGLIFDRALPEDAFGAPAIQLPVLVEQAGREHPIRPGVTSVGREGDIMVADSRVSRRHAEVKSDGGRLTISDLGSTNGTTVNGTRLEQGEVLSLNQGDTLGFGGFEMVLSLPGEAGKTQIPSANKTAAIASPPRLETPPAFLVGEGLTLPLKIGSNSFGRKADNDVQIADPYVSGSHGIIEVVEEGYFITDTGSTNGTMLNDARLSPNMRTRMTVDDEIRLGSLVFKIKEGDQQ